ncbi:MAG: acetyl-CoA carboxylase biotin carboxyl carrier protein [FCB group bacterium]|nr:acetyl-CoA carboxylase biotin carboxyl carrier protein [FCB group bacterium]
MNEKYIKKLIRIVEESEIESLEVSSWGRKIKITQRLSSSSNGSGDTHAVVQPVITHHQSGNVNPPQATVPVAEPSTPPVENTDNLVPIKSPMVGTFYTAPSPDADPYVSLNEKVTVGQVVCIVEAMKLMNEIESEVSGRVAKILVENGQPVEFGQTMFLIEPEK